MSNSISISALKHAGPWTLGALWNHLWPHHGSAAVAGHGRVPTRETSAANSTYLFGRHEVEELARMQANIGRRKGRNEHGTDGCPSTRKDRAPPYAPSPKRMRRRDSFEHLEERLHALRDALRAAKQGDFSVRLPTDGAAEGVMGEVALAFNALVEENDVLVRELRRVERSVGFEGKTTERASLDRRWVVGAWPLTRSTRSSRRWLGPSARPHPSSGSSRTAISRGTCRSTWTERPWRETFANWAPP